MKLKLKCIIFINNKIFYTTTYVGKFATSTGKLELFLLLECADHMHRKYTESFQANSIEDTIINSFTV